MVKTCKQIAEEIKDVERKLQQSKMIDLYYRNKKESIDYEISVDDQEEDKHTSRIKVGAN